VLVIGGAIGGFLLAHKLDQLNQDNSDLTGSNDSLRAQLREAQATPSPTTSPSPSASVTPAPSTSPAVSATPTPAPTKTPAKSGSHL
jgi:cell division septum initiation protein DivIVA